VETARQAMKGGAVDFIAKPFKISELCDLVVKITSQ
jgi:FixJ family two-component response regulator